jgi:hypothetical protein
VYGDPLWIPGNADEAACAAACDELAACLDDLSERAQQRLLIR